MDRHLSPAETAKRFGISIKALRLYEEHGLLKPLRTTNGTTGAAWRVYGPDQFARLLKILSLKRLGLSLSQISELLVGEDALDSILALQERLLAKDSERITHALILIRKARAKLASGEALSIDDLANLTQETVMSKQPTAEELKEIMLSFRQKHFTPEEESRLQQWNSDHSDIIEAERELMKEAKALIDSGEDANSPAAMDLARRLLALAEKFRASDRPLTTVLTPKLKATIDDVQSDPEASQKMSRLLEVARFIKQAVANLKAREDSSTRQG